MNIRYLLIGVLLVTNVVWPGGSSRADTISFDTSSLSGGPFYVNFQLIDGSGTGDANNTVTISGFAGIPLGAPIVSGGASGDLTGTVTLTDSAFFNEFIQQFTPSPTLRFDLFFTTEVDAEGTPDELSFAVLDSALAELPTTNPFGLNVLLTVEFSSSNPTVQTYALISSVPEPSTILLLGVGLAAMCIKIRHVVKSKQMRM